MLEKFFSERFWLRRWEAGTSDDQEIYDWYRGLAEERLNRLESYDQAAFDEAVRAAYFKIEQQVHSGETWFQPHTVEELSWALGYKLLEALWKYKILESTVVNFSEYDDHVYRSNEIKNELGLAACRLRDYLMGNRSIELSDFMFWCYENAISTGSLPLRKGLLTMAMELAQSDDAVELSSHEGMKPRMTIEELIKLHSRLVQTNMISCVNFDDFNDAFVKGKGRLEWKGTVAELSVFISTLKEKKKRRACK